MVEKAGVWRRKQVVRCLRSETRRMLEEVGLLGKRMGFRGGAGVYLVHKEEDAGHAMFFITTTAYTARIVYQNL